jgi:hypothetical protein
MALLITQQPVSLEKSVGESAEFLVETNGTPPKIYGTGNSLFTDGNWVTVAETPTIAADYIEVGGTTSAVEAVKLTNIAVDRAHTMVAQSTYISGLNYYHWVLSEPTTYDHYFLVRGNTASVPNYVVRVRNNAVTTTDVDIGIAATAGDVITTNVSFSATHIIVDLVITRNEVEIYSNQFTDLYDNTAISESVYYMGSTIGVARFTHYEIRYLAYQWEKNTVSIADEKLDTLTIDPIQGSDFASYTVKVSDGVEIVTSDIATLSRSSQPLLTKNRQKLSFSLMY